MLWITRSGVEAVQAQELFDSAGFAALAQPLFSLAPLPISPEQKTTILSLDHYDGVVFISKMAAEQGLNAFESFWPQFPLDQLWCAMGESSAQVLSPYAQTLVVADPPNSEGLLNQLNYAELNGQRWLIVRGNGGRELLRQELEGAGARVDYLELYRRENALTSELIQKLLNQPLSGIVIASTQAVDELLHCFGDDPKMLNLPLVVPGERAAKKAHEAGFVTVITASSATNDSLLSAWKKFKED